MASTGWLKFEGRNSSGVPIVKEVPAGTPGAFRANGPNSAIGPIPQNPDAGGVGGGLGGLTGIGGLGADLRLAGINAGGSNQILPGVTAPNLSGLFGNIDLWKGVGLILAGAAILIFAALEIKKGL